MRTAFSLGACRLARIFTLSEIKNKLNLHLSHWRNDVTAESYMLVG